MTCTEFSEVVHELLRPEQPASESVRRGLEHALLCDDCAAVLAEQRDLNDQLDDLADADRDIAAPAHVERNLLAALREQHPAQPAALPIWRWVAGLGFATAAFLIGAILFGHRPIEGPAGPAAQPSTPRTSISSMPLEASRVRASAPNSSSDATGQADSATSGGTSAQQASEQFYRMPYAFPSESTDGDSVLRVELPASELASMGLESSADPASDDGTQLVSADVVVAEDGTLEAIRLSPQQDQDTSTARF
jgi:negative regulator of sigma E activity